MSLRGRLPTLRKLFCTTARRRNSEASASEACAEIVERFHNKPISVRKQVLDANQLHLLNITLNRCPTSFDAPSDGTPIPAGHHLVYFTPSIIEDELGKDGTDKTVNPVHPYTRRMWAGGEMNWTQDEVSLLRVGQEIQETTKLTSAVPKQLKNGGQMLLVGVEKTFENNKGVALVDKRNWVFQPELQDTKVPQLPEAQPLPPAEHFRDFKQTPTSLFRFSALTFNAHKIHYLPEWCREVEGHCDAVVHGPLNLINMLDLWRDKTKYGGLEAMPKSISYQARSPLYVKHDYRITLEGADTEWRTSIWDQFGRKSMTGRILG